MQHKCRQVVTRIIRSEMSLQGVKYQALSERLAALGIEQTAENLRNKVNKGILGADLFIAVLSVLHARSLDSETINKLLQDID
jgi:hypothetical protein